MQRITAFHGTKLQSAILIIKDNFIVKEPKKNDNHWLGHGIYFYEDYDLADWWADTKVKRQNAKYGNNDEPAVVESCIIAEKIMNLDRPFVFKTFLRRIQEIESEIVKQGLVLNFTKNVNNTIKGENLIKQRERCFFLDKWKEQDDIDVIIYTFKKYDPAYDNSEYHKELLNSLGLSYNEKQICVTTPNCIKSNKIIDKSSFLSDSMNEVDEVII